MKKVLRTVLSFGFLVLRFQLFGQTQEMEQLKLNLEKLAQFKLILSQMKQGYQTLQNGYNTVSDAAKGNFNLHKKYLDGLLVVSPSVKQSPALEVIASDQGATIKLFQTAMQQFQMSGLFSARELTELSNQYRYSNQRVSDALNALALVTSSGKLRMSDSERLQAMDTIQKEIAGQFTAVKLIINEYTKVQALRNQLKKDTDALKRLNGLKY